MRILLLDIETAPHRVYAWGLWDQNISLNQIEEPGYTMCWAAKWLGEKKIRFSSINDTSMKKMVAEIHKLLCEADAVVHYNGTKFDIPILNQEFVKHHFHPPSPSKQIDLLKTARRRFRLPSNKLDYVARHLDLGGKLQHKGMLLWRGCMEGKKADWATMKRYNIQDVRLLEQVYLRLLPWIEGHPNIGLYDGITACPKCGSTHLQSRGTAKTMTMIYRRYQCTDCGSWSRGRMAERGDRPELVEAR